MGRKRGGVGEGKRRGRGRGKEGDIVGGGEGEGRKENILNGSRYLNACGTGCSQCPY